MGQSAYLSHHKRLSLIPLWHVTHQCRAHSELLGNRSHRLATLPEFAQLAKIDNLDRSSKPSALRTCTWCLVTILSGCEINNFAGQSAKSLCYNLVAMFDLFRIGLGAVLRGLRTRRSLMLENLALRQQLAIFKRQQPRPRLGAMDKLFWVVARRLMGSEKIWERGTALRGCGSARSSSRSWLTVQ